MTILTKRRRPAARQHCLAKPINDDQPHHRAIAAASQSFRPHGSSPSTSTHGPTTGTYGTTADGSNSSSGDATGAQPATSSIRWHTPGDREPLQPPTRPRDAEPKLGAANSRRTDRPGAGPAQRPPTNCPSSQQRTKERTWSRAHRRPDWSWTWSHAASAAAIDSYSF